MTTTPPLTTAATWAGRTVLDAESIPVGRCVRVLADDATAAPAWLALEVSEHRHVIVPAGGALDVGDGIRVAHLRDVITSAPRTGSFDHLSADDEERLHRHYWTGGRGPGDAGVLRQLDSVASAIRWRMPAQHRSTRGRAAVLTGLGAVAALVMLARRRRAARH